jgi:hypothetical protein
MPSTGERAEYKKAGSSHGKSRLFILRSRLAGAAAVTKLFQAEGYATG